VLGPGSIATARIEELMEELKARYTIVVVTHNMQQAARASDVTVSCCSGNWWSSATRPRSSPRRAIGGPRTTSRTVRLMEHTSRQYEQDLQELKEEILLLAHRRGDDRLRHALDPEPRSGSARR